GGRGACRPGHRPGAGRRIDAPHPRRTAGACVGRLVPEVCRLPPLLPEQAPTLPSVLHGGGRFAFSRVSWVTLAISALRRPKNVWFYSWFVRRRQFSSRCPAPACDELLRQLLLVQRCRSCAEPCSAQSISQGGARKLGAYTKLRNAKESS